MIRLGDFKPSDEQREMVVDILNSGRITEGKFVDLFEREVEKYIGVKHAIAVTNGTVSLQLIAHYLNYKYGNKLKIAVPATTFPATINAFLNAGFTDIELVEVGKDLNIDITTIPEEKRWEIDVIVPVALLGYPPNMELITKYAELYDWIVIEDFAEAFGSTYNGKKIGSIGDFGSSSFYMSHVIQAGELGVVTTNDDEAAKIMRSMKNHGRVGNSLLFLHDYVGSNYKTTEFCAALAYSNLKHADEIIRKRQENTKKIHDGIRNPRLLPFPFTTESSYLGYPIYAGSKAYRDELCKRMYENGVETRGMFPCLANQKAYKGKFLKKLYPKSIDFEESSFYVGVHQYLTDEEVQKIIEVLNDGN